VSARFAAGIADLKRAVRRVARAAQEEGRRARHGARHVNISGRTNVVVARNVGQSGTTVAATASQTADIRQPGGAAQRTARPDTAREGGE
jgi:hypothetical protein